MAELLRHRQTKGAETDMLSLTPPRHTSTLRIPAEDSRSRVDSTSSRDASPGRRVPRRPLVAQDVGRRQITALMSAITSALRSSSGPRRAAAIDGPENRLKAIDRLSSTPT
jgi:hypothetical protein